MNQRFIGTRRAVVALCLGLLVVLGRVPTAFAAACTTVCYVDAATGNDANDGDTAATAKKTIQAAVNQVTAGGQVYVLDGTYPEAVTVNKAVTITGNGPANTTVDPVSGNGITITASNVTIEDLKITGAAQGARLSGNISDITFDNVTFLNNTSRGIEVQNGAGVLISNVEVLNSLFDNNNVGIRMSSTTVVDGFTIDNTTFQNHPSAGSGIGFYQSNDNNNGYVKNLHIDNSTFTGSGMSGVYLEEAIDVEIENSDFTGNARGAMIFDWYDSTPTVTDNISIHNNTFTDNTAASVMIIGGSGNGLGGDVDVNLNTFSQDVGALAANWSVVDIRLQSGFTHGTANITNNQITFSGTYGVATATYGIRVRGAVDAVNITGNTLDGGSVGNNGGTPATAGIYVSSNDGYYGAMKAASVITVGKNLINDFPQGVVVYDPVALVYGGLPAGATLNVNRNDLGGNTAFGIQSGAGATTNGQCNWWGDASGPGPVGPGSGSNVSANVDYPVWLFADDLNGGNVTNTDTGEVFCSIQEGIDDSDTLDGHTLVASAGVYLEQVNIYKSVELVGAGATTTFIKAPATMPIASNPDSTIVKVTGASVSAEIHDFTITGPGPTGCGSIQAGIFVRDGAYANIHDNTITDIRDTGDSGCQNGNAIMVGRYSLGTSGTAAITNNLIDNYQKNGIVVTNTGSDATITGNQVLGDGPKTTIAENGIQIGDGATAEIVGNTVSGHSYTPFSWVSTGIMLYQAGETNTDGNTITENQVGIYIYDTDGTHKNNTINATATGTGSPGYYGLIAYPTSGQTTTLTGNTFTSDNSSGGMGLYADASSGYTLTATKNKVHNWEYGILVDGTDPATVNINRNSIVGNTNDGLFSEARTPETNGTCNWWGNASGPSDAGPGTGDKVSTDVDYDPWLGSSNLDGPCPAPTNVCNLPDASPLWTDILGKGMGNTKKHKVQMKINIPNYTAVDSLYGQMVAKNTGHANYVRFIMPGRRNWVQVNTITSPAVQQAGNFWYGDYIDPAKLPTKSVAGRWFLQKTGTRGHIPRALVLYPTYTDPVNTWVNIWNTYDAAEAEVYWDTALGWTPTQVITESIAPPNGPTTFNIELALVDNDKDARPVWVTVEAGGVSQTQTPNNPDSGDQLNLMTFTLDVPAGTDEITITVYSPSAALDDVEGDSAMLVGMRANYMCAPLLN